MAEITSLFPKDQPLEPPVGRPLERSEYSLYVQAQTEYLLAKYGLTKENVQMRGSARDKEMGEWLITHRVCFREYCQRNADEIFPRLKKDFSGGMEDLKRDFEAFENSHHPSTPEELTNQHRAAA